MRDRPSDLLASAAVWYFPGSGAAASPRPGPPISASRRSSFRCPTDPRASNSSSPSTAPTCRSCSAIACGCAGFAMVWALGLGRTSRGSGDEGPVSLPVVTVLSPVEEISEPAERAPGFQQTTATEPAADLQPQPVAPPPEVPASAPEDRYANRTVSHETAVPAGPTATERFSRFGPAADPSPSFVMTVGAVEAAGNRDLDDLASPASPTPETVPTGPESETPLPDNVPLPLADSEPLADALPLPEDSGDLAAPVSQDNAPAETAADDTPPSPPAPVAPPAATEDPMPMRVVGNPLRGSAMAVPPSPPPPAKQVSAAVPFAAARRWVRARVNRPDPKTPQPRHPRPAVARPVRAGPARSSWRASRRRSSPSRSGGRAKSRLERRPVTKSSSETSAARRPRVHAARCRSLWHHARGHHASRQPVTSGLRGRRERPRLGGSARSRPAAPHAWRWR